MSGIYISGMKMPKDDMKNIMILTDGRVFQFSGYGNPKPLGIAIPVPEHGDLIDANKFFRSFPELRPYAFIAPTIIPADEEEQT